MNILARQSVTTYNRGRVDLLSHKLVGILQKLSGNDDHRGGAVTHLFILQLGQLAQNLSRWVLDLQQFQDCGTIIGYCHILKKGCLYIKLFDGTSS